MRCSAVANPVVNWGFSGGENGNNIMASVGGCGYSQFVHSFCPASSSFQDLLEHVVVAVDVVIFFPQRRNGPACVEDGRVVAVSKGITDIREAHLGEIL